MTPVDSSGSTLTPLSAGNATSAQLTAEQGLIIGGTYTFDVVAESDSGTESSTASSNAVVESAAPLAVTGLAAKVAGKGTATVTWQCDASCADGNPVTKFVIATAPASTASPISVAATSATSYTATLPGLVDATSYTLSVTASNNWGSGQAATAVVVSEGQPTATVTGYTPSGLTEVVGFTVNDKGAAVTSCSLTGISGGASESGSGCAGITVYVPMYDTGYSGTITIDSDYAPGGAAGATFSFTSGLKALDADATPDWGTCPSNPPPTNEKYCGASSGSCPGPAFSGCNSSVAGGTTENASCWTTGSSINNSYSGASPGAGSTVSSNIWVDIPALGGDPWMSVLYFNPAGNAANGSPTTDNLPAC